jgi:hypothetical protein
MYRRLQLTPLGAEFATALRMVLTEETAQARQMLRTRLDCGWCSRRVPKRTL